MRGVPSLKELNAKYKDRGLKLLAVSNEETSTIEGFVQGDKKPDYTVVQHRAMKELYGVQGWPSAWVLDADGRILWADHFVETIGAEQWEKWLSELAPTKVGKSLHKDLNSAVKAFDKGEVGKAMAEARKVADSATEDALKADCEYLNGLCAKHVTLYENKMKAAGTDVVAKVKLMEEGAAKLKGSEIGSKWEAEAKELKKSDSYAATEALAKLKPVLGDMKKANARRKLEALAKKYPDTDAGKEAAELAKEYED